MGTFQSQGKNEYYWRLLQYVADEHVFDTDAQVIPYTPAQPLYYTAVFPSLYTVFPQTQLGVYINGRLAVTGFLTGPPAANPGTLYVPVQTPLGQFTLQVVDAYGNVLLTEVYNAKNYAMFLDVAAQSYEDRRVAIEQVISDRSYATLRSDRVYAVVGANFDFPIPPGWTPDQYRATVLGDGVCKPGLTTAFNNGGTQLGVLQGVRSILGSNPLGGCYLVEALPVDDGGRWILFDRNNPAAPNPAVGGPTAWYSSTQAVAAPSNRILLHDENYFAYASVLRIHGVNWSVVGEQVAKNSDSFIQAQYPEPYNLAGKTLTFTVENTDDPTTWMSFTTTFVAATTAVAAAAEILAQNPALGPAVYGDAGFLRVGVPPAAGVTRNIVINGGTALGAFGWVAGQDVDVANDTLQNAYLTSAAVLTWDAFTYNQGVDFNVTADTGELVWLPSAAGNNIPPRGAILTATYTYVPMREVLLVVNLLKAVSDQIELEFVP